ncbi:MAG: hypothetical protein Q8N62_03120, partial [Candidatus Omnitrophota bacterium]|nr:hypothetical protein [Candidatus Omnitrophota bacterium]
RSPRSVGEFKAYDRTSGYRPFYLAMSLGVRASHLLAIYRNSSCHKLFKILSELRQFIAKIGLFLSYLMTAI